MASCFFPLPLSVNRCHRHNGDQPPIYNCTATADSLTLCYPAAASKINLNRSFLFKRNTWSGRCHAASSPPEPPSKKHQPPSSGVTATFMSFKDTLQVFFAVLFWMSLFFWSSAWDGGNSGRPNKGSRMRKK